MSAENDPAARARAGFAAAFGGAAQGIAFAPGRVNLIGEHVDYNAGLVLPMPIGPGTAVAWRARADGEVHAIALDYDDARDSFALAAPAPVTPCDWRGYLRGMTVGMAERALPVAGADLAIAGSLPRGAGLSSSASLCIAAGRALAAAAGAPGIDPVPLALAAQNAEHRFAGVRCGIMDQLVIAAGTPGSATLIDCRDLAVHTVPLPREWAVLIVQSGVVRGLVDGDYNARRAACETAARELGLANLREASLDQVARLADPAARRCARHVVSEIARTAAAVAAIEARDLGALGQLFAASHASLRDDFAITVPAVDDLVAALNRAIGGAGGARMTGAGFGGAVVAVLAAAAVPRVSGAIAATWRTPQGTPPELLIERCGPRDPAMR